MRLLPQARPFWLLYLPFSPFRAVKFGQLGQSPKYGDFLGVYTTVLGARLSLGRYIRFVPYGIWGFITLLPGYIVYLCFTQVISQRLKRLLGSPVIGHDYP